MIMARVVEQLDSVGSLFRNTMEHLPGNQTTSVPASGNDYQLAQEERTKSSFKKVQCNNLLCVSIPLSFNWT